VLDPLVNTVGQLKMIYLKLCKTRIVSMQKLWFQLEKEHVAETFPVFFNLMRKRLNNFVQN